MLLRWSGSGDNARMRGTSAWRQRNESAAHHPASLYSPAGTQRPVDSLAQGIVKLVKAEASTNRLAAETIIARLSEALSCNDPEVCEEACSS